MTGAGTWLLAALVGLGALVLLRWVRRHRPAGARESGLRLVVLVKNREAIIEGFIRELFRILGSVKNVELAVVDQGSTDATPFILERLGRLFPFEVWRRDPQAAEGDATNDLLGLVTARPVTVVLRLERAADVRGVLKAVGALARGTGARGRPEEVGPAPGEEEALLP